MIRRTVVFVVKLLVVFAIFFALAFWLSALWSDWDYHANILWNQYLHGRRLPGCVQKAPEY